MRFSWSALKLQNMYCMWSQSPHLKYTNIQNLTVLHKVLISKHATKSIISYYIYCWHIYRSYFIIMNNTEQNYVFEWTPATAYSLRKKPIELYIKYSCVCAFERSYKVETSNFIVSKHFIIPNLSISKPPWWRCRIQQSFAAHMCIWQCVYTGCFPEQPGQEWEWGGKLPALAVNVFKDMHQTP